VTFRATLSELVGLSIYNDANHLSATAELVIQGTDETTLS